MTAPLRLAPWVSTDDERMLPHLSHFEAKDSADALVELEKPEHLDVWVVFHFPDTYRVAKPKAVLYGRMWGFRKRGIDAMVRQLSSGRYVLVVRRYV